MNRFLPALLLIAGFAAISWADTESDDPVDTGNAVQLQPDIETDVDSAASPYAARRQFRQRVATEVLNAITQALEDNPDISEADKQAAAHRLRDWSRYGDIDIDIDGDLWGSRPWLGAVSILSIVLIFGTPIMLVAAVLYASHRKRRMASDMASQFLANGQPVPPEVWRGLAGDASPRSNLHNGMIMLGVGLGIFLCFWLIGSVKAAYLGLIPLFIGIAQLLIWILEKQKTGPGE